MSNPNGLTLGGQAKHKETGEIASVTYENDDYGNPSLIISGPDSWVTEGSPDFKNWYPV